MARQDPGGLLVTRRAMCSIRGVMLVVILARPVFFPSFGLQDGRVMSMEPVPWPEPDPQVAAAVRATWSRGSAKPLAVAVRDRLGEGRHDAGFAAAGGVRGRPGGAASRRAPGAG